MNHREGAVGGRFGVIGVLLNYLLASIAPASCTRRLVRRLSSTNEETSMAAYMALVKLGPKTRRRLLEIARRGESTAAILRILGDQGDPEAIAELEGFLPSADPEVIDAAEYSIRMLSRSEEE